MEIAIGISGLSFTILGLILAYTWRSNGQMQMRMTQMLERIDARQVQMTQAVGTMTQVLERMDARQVQMTQILERMDGRQVQMAQILGGIDERQLEHTKILSALMERVR